MLKLGFLVNPIAGMGGRIGLKGTDGLFKKAISMGAEPVAPMRGVEFLKKLKKIGITEKIKLVTPPCEMGENEAEIVGVRAKILDMSLSEETTAEDTKKAIELMVAEEVNLIVFVGGDGTARDIMDKISELSPLPVLGIPSGVKMYSGVFAINPSDAAHIVEAFLNGQAQLVEFEIIDADEEAIRKDNFSIKVYGFLKGPMVPMLIQGSKQVSPSTIDEQENQDATAKFIMEEMDPKATYILGPGSTVKTLANLLNVKKTLLGVDIYHNGMITQDVNEGQILKAIKDWDNTWIIVSPIGKQGIIFGRGNQQISPKIVKLVEKEKIIVLATRSKIQGISEGVLRVDSGDAKVDRLLSGFIRVATDYREWRVLRVK